MTAPDHGWRWRYFRRHGVRATLHAVINRYLYRSHAWVVLRTRLAGSPAADHVGNVTFRLATPSDLERLAGLARYGRGTTLRASVTEDNDWLFVACREDRVVATRLYSRMVPPHGLMARVIQLEQGQVWMSDLFCLPEYRNQGIGRHLALFADRFLAARGCTELFMSVSVTNLPSLRLSLHKGSRPFRYVSYFRLLFYERLLVSKEIPRQFEA